MYPQCGELALSLAQYVMRLSSHKDRRKVTYTFPHVHIVHTYSHNFTTATAKAQHAPQDIYSSNKLYDDIQLRF